MQIHQSHAILLAEQVVRESFTYETNHEKQKVKLAKAYFTLAQNPDSTLTEVKLHLNSCISILQNMEKKGYKWCKDITLAHHRRAEIYENENKLELAIADYKKAAEILSSLKNLNDDNNFLLAECYLSVADILMYQFSEKDSDSLVESYYYANLAIKSLQKAKTCAPELLACLSYAYQTAGIALSEIDFDESIKNFREALGVIYKYNSIEYIQSVAENIKYLSILYSIKSLKEESRPLIFIYEEISTIYNYLNQFLENFYEDESDIEYLEKAIYHVAKLANNPYVDKNIQIEIVDVLMYLHFNIVTDDLDLGTLYYPADKYKYANLISKVIYNIISNNIFELNNPIKSSFINLKNSIKNHGIYEIAYKILDRNECKIYSFPTKKIIC